MTTAVTRGLVLLCCASPLQGCAAKPELVTEQGGGVEPDCEQLCEKGIECEVFEYTDAVACHNACISLTADACDPELHDFSTCARDISCELDRCAVEEALLVDCWGSEDLCLGCTRYTLCDDIPTCGAPGEGEGEVPDGYCEVGTAEYEVVRCAIDNEDSFCNGTDTSFVDCFAGGNPAINIAVSGTLSVHPVSWTFNQNVVVPVSFGSPGDVVIAIIDPVDALGAGFDPTVDNLAIGPPEPCTPDPVDGNPSCPFNFANVDISGLSLGLVGFILDARVPRVFDVTSVTIFGSSTATDLKGSGADYDTATLLAVSNESARGMAGLTNAGNYATMIASGYMFGSMLDNASNPVAGVTVSASDPGMGPIVYPEQLSVFTTAGSTTDATGFFLTVGTPPTLVSAFSAAGTVGLWNDIPAAGTRADTVSVLLWTAQ